LQRVLGELKGSMEGVKIRIEVEGEGWRGRVDRLEKLSEFMAGTEKLLRQEREQVQMMIEERIEKQLKAQQLGICWADMKNEMHLLWNEMDSLIKSREDMAGHVEHLTFVTKKVQEHSSCEQDMLKSENGFLRKQLQSLQDEGVQVSHSQQSNVLEFSRACDILVAFLSCLPVEVVHFKSLTDIVLSTSEVYLLNFFRV
jgi:hypothetical protein